MDKIPVIVLAGGEKGPLYEPTGYENKALIPIHGKPMIDWVVESFVNSDIVGDIVVVGSDELDECASMRHVRKRLPQGINLMQNILSAVTYVKTSIHKNSSNHPGYIISFCDAVFLTPNIVKDTVTSITDANADVVLHYVEKSSFESDGLPANRTYIPVDGKNYTGSTIYYLRKFSLVSKMLSSFGEMRKNRKDPKGLLRALNCEDLDLDGIGT